MTTRATSQGKKGSEMREMSLSLKSPLALSWAVLVVDASSSLAPAEPPAPQQTGMCRQKHRADPWGKDRHNWTHRYCRNVCLSPKKMCHLQHEAGAWSKARHQQGVDEPVPSCDVYN